jgi:hypothetical protein
VEARRGVVDEEDFAEWTAAQPVHVREEGKHSATVGAFEHDEASHSAA